MERDRPNRIRLTDHYNYSYYDYYNIITKKRAFYLYRCRRYTLLKLIFQRKIIIITRGLDRRKQLIINKTLEYPSGVRALHVMS